MIDYIFVVVLLLLLFAFLSPFSSEANTAFLSLSLCMCVCVCMCVSFIKAKQSSSFNNKTLLYCTKCLFFIPRAADFGSRPYRSSKASSYLSTIA